MRTIPKQLGRCALVICFVLTSAKCQELSLAEETSSSSSSTVDGEGGLFNVTSVYSVIVVASNPRPTNHFRDERRVLFYGRLSGEDRAVSVQVANPSVKGPVLDGEAPFGVGHPDGVDKRVRMVFMNDLRDPNANQISHLRAACDDHTETTVVILVDETCRETLPQRLLSTCGLNGVRIYPFNAHRDDMESRIAYVPLGPRNSFPFVPRDTVPAALARSLFFNLQVTTKTSPRRETLASIVEQYRASNPDVPSKAQQPKLNSDQWQALLLDSTFTLCPAGHNGETFRMWEALEAGSIPIVSKTDYTDPVYSIDGNTTCGKGDISWNTVASSPFARNVPLDTWDDLPSQLDILRQKPNGYIQNLQEDCLAWYDARMNKTYNSLLNFGEGKDMFPQLGPILDLP